MIFASLVSLIAATVVSQEIQADEAKAPFVGEALEGFGRCGGCGKPSCLNPVVHFQNYQDVNTDVIEYYNFETSFPLIGFEAPTWEISNEGYDNGDFQMISGSPIFLTRNAPLVLENRDVTYISAQLEYASFVSTEFDIESPLGAGGDPFYAAAFFSAYDSVDTGLEYAFAITNSTVFAIYGRSNVAQTPENNYKAFRYLVPIQPHLSNSTYTLILNHEDGSVGWMIDGIIRMVIPISGKAIDQKFMIEDQGGVVQQAAFPSAVTVSIGGDRLYTGVPHTACQEAIFQYCDRGQSVFNATNVECVYEPIQESFFFIFHQMSINMFSITQATAMKPACSCPCQG